MVKQKQSDGTLHSNCGDVLSPYVTSITDELEKRGIKFKIPNKNVGYFILE